VIVVEHDEDAILPPTTWSTSARRRHPWRPDHRRGHARRHHGQSELLTGQVPLSGELRSRCRRSGASRRAAKLNIVGARGNNLKNVTADDPARLFTCVTGVSGGGKSTLMIDTLYKARAAAERRARASRPRTTASTGLEFLDKVIDIDQSPIGRTPRSNPATYTGAFTPIRDWFAGLPEAKARGYSRAASPSTSRAAAARPARATASSRSRCTSCPTSTSPATSARASATTARRWRCSSRASRSPTCST
jgi:excinuclease ABC subunit A